MIKKGLILAIVLFCYVFSFSWISQNQPFIMFSKKHKDAKILPPATLIKVISGEFDSIFSAVFFAYGSALIGNLDSSSTREDWEYAYDVIKLCSDIDPYFKDPYVVMQGIFIWTDKISDRTETISFLKTGIPYRTWDSRLPFFIGFDYFFFFNNYQESAKYLFMSAKLSKSPFTASLASKIASKGGDVETGIEFLSNMNTDSMSEPVKRTFNQRLEALKGVQILQNAMKKYEKIYGEKPNNLEELITKGLISKMPNNPYKTTYKIKNGQITHDEF